MKSSIFALTIFVSLLVMFSCSSDEEKEEIAFLEHVDRQLCKLENDGKECPNYPDKPPKFEGQISHLRSDYKDEDFDFEICGENYPSQYRYDCEDIEAAIKYWRIEARSIGLGLARLFSDSEIRSIYDKWSTSPQQHGYMDCGDLFMIEVEEGTPSLNKIKPTFLDTYTRCVFNLDVTKHNLRREIQQWEWIIRRNLEELRR